MFKRIIAVVLLLLCAHAHAALPDDYRVVLLTENFPPFNMAEDGKNYASDARIHGINADIVREMFHRADIRYELTLRFPWDRIYKQVLQQPDQGLFSTTFTAEREPLFKWVGPLASISWVLLAPADSPLRLTGLEQARDLRIGAYKNDAVSQHLEGKGLAPINSLRDQENIWRQVCEAMLGGLRRHLDRQGIHRFGCSCVLPHARVVEDTIWKGQGQCL